MRVKKEIISLVQMEDDGCLNLNRSLGFPREKFRADIYINGSDQRGKKMYLESLDHCL